MTPSFYYVVNISLSCNINIPSFIGNLWWVLLLGNHLNRGSCKGGRDPFNQNFRKFRTKTLSEWIGSVQPEKFRKIGSRWNTFLGWTATEMDRSINLSGPFSIPVPRCSVFSMYNMEKNTFFGAGTLTSMSSYSTTVLKLKTIYFSREFEFIRQISGNGLLKIMLRMKQLTQYPH